MCCDIGWCAARFSSYYSSSRLLLSFSFVPKKKFESLPIESLGADREQHVPDSSNHSPYLNTPTTPPCTRHQHHTHTHHHTHIDTHTVYTPHKQQHLTTHTVTAHKTFAHTHSHTHTHTQNRPTHTTHSSPSLGAKDLCSYSKHSQDHGQFGCGCGERSVLHDVTGQPTSVVVIFAKTCETLAVRERLIGRNMHIGHRRDSTRGRMTHTEAYQRVAERSWLQSNVIRTATVGSTLIWAEWDKE